MSEQKIQFTDGVRQTYQPKLNTISRCATTGLRAWLATSDNFVPVDTGNGKCIELSLYDAEEVLSYWANDVVRLSCASIETANAIALNTKDKKFLAWQLIQYYYSAFYSAHATLKLCGFGLIQIDQRMINNIRRRASTLGITLPKYDAGVYCADISVKNSKVTFFVVSKYNDSHKGLWKRYVDFLHTLSGVYIKTGSHDANCVRIRTDGEDAPLSVYSQVPSPDNEIIISRIDDLRSALDRHGDCNWLSSIRNSVNYNHAFGVWFPFKDYEEDYASVVKAEITSLYQQEPLSNQFAFNEKDCMLLTFVKCCQLVNSINLCILKDYSKRHPENKSFLRYGPLAFMKLHE